MLSLVLPKGSLEQQTLRLFEEADLPIRRKSDREYNATIDDPRIGQVKILRPQEIPQYIQQGYFDLGITGLDWIQETNSTVVDIMDLAFSKQGIGAPVKIVLAVAQESGITDPSQIRPGSRISTEYLDLTRRYFAKLGISVEVFPSYGATEAKVPEIADAIVDVTETGATLVRHGMRIIAVILESTTRLIANANAYDDSEKRQQIEEITTLLSGVLAARGKVLIKLNVSEANLEAVVSVLPSMKAPTVSRLFNTDYYAVETVVVKSDINLLIPELKRKGAEDILEIPMLKIVK
ncbi:MAG: ATP phosphoribosyltransferase [Chloroflexi bacterium]|nr:ATP phosphoribosyltransferase [Chloroflexota bacterium]MDA8189833.1 ATP phosphoribosyltransferase [Dehalococcoidales bacterium]